MKRLFALAALAALAFPALAGGGLDGYRCENACPLAKSANSHRAYGTEAARASTVAAADLAREIQANLARI
jgi:hypothetical protein